MASLEATLEVAGQRYPLVHATFGVSQPTGRRGRAATKVRYSLVELALDVPLDDRLLSWATDPTQRQAASLTFSDASTGTALETLSLGAAYCVGYREEFEAGAEGTGSYYCALVLSDPDGFTMQAGGPSAAFAAPAAGTHGAAVAAVAVIAEAAVQGKTIVGEPAATAYVSSLPLPLHIAPASWMGSQTHDATGSKLVANTLLHKTARWAEYQRDKINNPKAYDQARWSKQYDTNMQNTTHGLKREREYAAAMGGSSKTVKTPFTQRQIDVYREDSAYCGQVKTGKVGLTKQAKEDLQKDEFLINEQYTVEYILEKGASKPMLAALKKIGADVKIGPQIP